MAEAEKRREKTSRNGVVSMVQTDLQPLYKGLPYASSANF